MEESLTSMHSHQETTMRWKRSIRKKLSTSVLISLRMTTTLAGTRELSATAGDQYLTKSSLLETKLNSSRLKRRRLSTSSPNFAKKPLRSKEGTVRLDGCANFTGMPKMRSWLPNKETQWIRLLWSLNASKSNWSPFTKILSTMWSSKKWATKILTTRSTT